MPATQTTMPVTRGPRRAVTRAVEGAVARAFRGESSVVLAVSGGRDSMALLEAAARVARDRVAAVATFDHGTGAAATDACELAASRARELGLEVERGVADQPLRGESAWRRARWEWLHRVARARRARVATAHTRDDHLETVLMRALRGAGARGLAALDVDGPVLRPLLSLTRAEVDAFAEERSVRWLDDPTNASLAHLRNRVRLELLPALEGAQPGFGRELLDLSRRAATLRREVERLVRRHVRVTVHEGSLAVARSDLVRYDAQGLATLWPAIAARLGVALDRRGTARLSEFTIGGAPGARIQLSGGVEVVAHRGKLVLRRMSVLVACDARPLRDGTSFGGWRFRRGDGAPRDAWGAELPEDDRLEVRMWRPGDRMVPLGAAAPRRVKGLLRDAGVDAARRAGWPVVLAEGRIVWIPGVRRSGAAAVRSGGPSLTFLCERIDERDG